MRRRGGSSTASRPMSASRARCGSACRGRSSARSARPSASWTSDRRNDMEQKEAFICDAVRTPFGRYGGALSAVRTDDLAAVPIRALMQRNARVDWAAVDDVFYGCANQAGEDNRNVARMASLLAGLPD